MTMQRRHYEFIASVIKDLQYGPAYLSPSDRKDVARTFAGALSRTNAQFNPSRFLKACGVEE